MYRSIVSKIQRDKDYPERQFSVDVLSRVLNGTLYDHMPYGFHEEKNGAGEYVPIRDRRPSVRYALCRIVVDDSVSLLFSEGHFPAVDCADETTRETLTTLAKECNLNEIMIQAATTGSVGSVAILMRVLSNRLFFNVFNTQFLTLAWRADAPDTLERVTEKYKVKGSALMAQGYKIDAADKAADFWFSRQWDEKAETWFEPWKVVDDKPGFIPSPDKKRTTTHNLGFVPIVWVKNLPGGDEIDGKCTFPPEAIDTQIEIDYQLSQGGRGLKYSSDPTLLIKEPAVDNDGTMVKGGGNAIVVNEKGDARMLEINGTASAAVIEYVKALRELALESAHGNRSNADKLSAAQSGRAMELMTQSLIWLADKLRISYGEGALLSILKMMVLASNKFSLVDKQGEAIGKLNVREPISLRWPNWFAPTYADKQSEATTLDVLTKSQLLSQETAVKAIAGTYDIEDPEEELNKIKAQPQPAVAGAQPKQEPLSQSDD